MSYLILIFLISLRGSDCFVFLPGKQMLLYEVGGRVSSVLIKVERAGSGSKQKVEVRRG